MYSQFFGNFLLSKHAVTSNQILRAIQNQHAKHLRLGTLAIHEGYMSASQVDEIFVQQTHTDRRFGELAIQAGYLTMEQLNALLEAQTPNYLLIGQALVDDGALTNAQLEQYIQEYHADSQLNELEVTGEQQDNLVELVRQMFLISSESIPEYAIRYVKLLFNNLIRFIGEDFMPLNPILCTDMDLAYCSSQALYGDFAINSYLETSEETAIAFASRYVNDEFSEFDDYVKASIDDFLNLHNGLFVVNMSNEYSVELNLEAPMIMENVHISTTDDTYLLPVVYPFGTLNFILKINCDIA